MPAGKIDIHFYILQFRRLAARHQTGESLEIITQHVEELIKTFEQDLGEDCFYQVASWGELSRKMTSFVRNTSDPNWVSVISYVRKRINAKKQTAIHRRKQRNS